MQDFEDRFQAESGWNYVNFMQDFDDRFQAVRMERRSSILTLLGSGRQNPA
jgi:hypothetical protein